VQALSVSVSSILPFRYGLGGVPNRTIGVNLEFLEVCDSSSPINAAPLGFSFSNTRFYINAEEILKQINPIGLKNSLGYAKFMPKIQRGCKQHLPWFEENRDLGI
jgi:hypothetical protein